MFKNAAVVAPGDPTGDLYIYGGFEQLTTGVLEIDIAGPDAFDRIVYSGDAILDGILNVTLLDGYAPSPDDEFAIIFPDEYFGYSSDLYGVFRNAPQRVTLDNGYFEITYTPTSVSLSNFTVPEPAVLATITIGLAGACSIRRRSKSVIRRPIAS